MANALKLIAQEKIEQTGILDLGNCGLTELPDELFELTWLETLYLSYDRYDWKKREWIKSKNKGEQNKIERLSSHFKKLINLKELQVSEQAITDISVLEYYSSLTVLNLYGNQITDISFLSGLTNLETLNLSSNQITDISTLLPLIRLGKMHLSLEQYGWSGKINLYENPIEKPPLEIVKKGNQAVIDWFEADKKRLEEIKIILVGEPKAGKTSILRRLKDNAYIEGEKQTDGINIESIAFGDNQYFEEQEQLHTLTGHFWDFGGQEIMSATHQFFLTNRSVYVLVLDARIDTQVATQIQKWLQQIQANGGNSPIIVVANQIDVNKGFGFENEVELQQEFPQIKAFIKTSCKTGENLDTLRDLLEQFIPEAELFHTEIDEKMPTSWAEFKALFFNKEVRKQYKVEMQQGLP